MDHDIQESSIFKSYWIWRWNCQDITSHVRFEATKIHCWLSSRKTYKVFTDSGIWHVVFSTYWRQPNYRITSYNVCYTKLLRGTLCQNIQTGSFQYRGSLFGKYRRCSFCAYPCICLLQSTYSHRRSDGNDGIYYRNIRRIDGRQSFTGNHSIKL